MTLYTHFALALHGVGLKLKDSQLLLTLNPSSSWQEQLRFMFLHTWQFLVLGEAKNVNVWLSSCSFAIYLVVQLINRFRRPLAPNIISILCCMLSFLISTRWRIPIKTKIWTFLDEFVKASNWWNKHNENPENNHCLHATILILNFHQCKNYALRYWNAFICYISNSS